MRMPNRLAVVAAALALGAAGCGPASEDGAVLLRVPEDPTITFKVWFKVGSQDDPPGRKGLAYMTAQMLAQGSTTENSYEQILEKLYPMAAGYDVSVDREMTVLSGRTHRDNLDAYYALFSDAYLRPAFKEEDFRRLRSNALNYLKNTLRYASDEELGKAALYGFVFDGTPYAHTPEGTVESLEAMTLDDVKEFYRTHYTRANAEVALGGGFSDELVAWFEQARGGLPEGPARPAPAVAAPAFQGRHALLVSKPNADCSISFGFPIDVRRGERDFYALWIANSWLGEHRNSASHLYQVIRETRGMNYGDYSYIEAFPEGGRRNVPPTHVARRQQIFEVWIRTLPCDQAHFAIRAAMRELQRLVDEGMSEEDFRLTREFLSKYVLHFAETTSARLGYAVDDRFYGIDEAGGHLARFRRMLPEITREEVNQALRRHLRYADLKLAIVTGDAERLRQALAEESPSPIEYGSPKPPEVLEEDRQIATFRLGFPAENVRIVPVDEMFQR